MISYFVARNLTSRRSSEGGVELETATHSSVPLPSIDIVDILADCESFIKQVKNNIREQQTDPSTFGSIKAWRAKRAAQELTVIYDGLYPKITDAEEKLRKAMLEISEKKYALREQGMHLKERVNSCIIFNGSNAEQLSKSAESIRRILDSLTHEATRVKSMIAFNTELIRQRKAEDFSKGRSFVSWDESRRVARIAAAQREDDPASTSRGRGGFGYRGYGASFTSVTEVLYSQTHTPTHANTHAHASCVLRFFLLFFLSFCFHAQPPHSIPNPPICLNLPQSASIYTGGDSARLRPGEAAPPPL
jgi:hypothetical protein